MSDSHNVREVTLQFITESSSPGPLRSGSLSRTSCDPDVVTRLFKVTYSHLKAYPNNIKLFNHKRKHNLPEEPDGLLI